VRHPECRLTDAALVARDYFKTSNAVDVLRRSLVGRLMLEWDFAEEVDYAAGVDHCSVTAELRGDHVESV
jgi:hypothetical protein